jgi:dihydrodipicolinate synthase/N-acetylneuraminate lyase
MTAPFDIVVPALAILDNTGAVDRDRTLRYAERASATWVDRFILSGSTTRGQDLTPAQRGDILDLWLTVAQPQRLLACCWDPEDFEHAARRGIAPMATMRKLDGIEAAVTFLRHLPTGAYIYSHPMFGGNTFDAALAQAATQQGILLAGGKLAKITTPAITEIHTVTGDAFRLWDGSSRRIQRSLNAGAAGVVATPLCAFNSPLPEKEPGLIQAIVDSVQDALDALPDRPARTRELLSRAGHHQVGTS